jgi:hypothetical protein
VRRRAAIDELYTEEPIAAVQSFTHFRDSRLRLL